MLNRLLDVLKVLALKPSLHKQWPKKRSHCHAKPNQASPTRKQPYVRPAMYKLNLEQGALILLGRAWDGDNEAKEFLTHLFPG
jgi:hypothetical protein